MSICTAKCRPQTLHFVSMMVQNLLFTAFENAADMNDKDSVRDAFYNIKGYEGIAGTFDYSAKDGDGLSGCNAYMIIGGEYYAFDKATLEKEVPVK